MRFLSLLAVALTSASGSSILLDTTGGASPGSVQLTFGTYGQGVYVGTDTTLTQIGIWVASPAAGSADFQIWDGSNTDLLFSETQSVAAGIPLSVLLSTPFSFDLGAGQTYYFDVFGPYGISKGPGDPSGGQTLGFIAGTGAPSQNNLTPIWPNSVYLGPSDPGGIGGSSFTLPLELIGSQTPIDAGPPSDPPTPEPATFVLMALGCALLILLKRAS